nr:FAD-binding oxidoreductase [Aliiroseovarius subalbicans]
MSKLGRVTLLEGESALGYHASGRSAAMFEESYGLPPVKALNRASRDFHMTENGGVLSPRGLMLLGGAGDEARFAHDMVEMAMEPISPAEAQAIVPILDTTAVTMAGIHTEAWDLDTDLLIQNFARDIRATGQVITGASVDSITRTPSGWQVVANGQSHEAPQLVNAAGAWVDEVANLAGITPLGFQPFRRSMARLPAPGGHDVTRWPMIFGAGETWYAKPDAGALLVSPAEQDPVPPQDAWADDMVLAEGLARYEAMVTEPVTRMISNWAGLRTFSPDRNLVIGRSPEDESFLWMAGQGGYGFQTAPAASRLLADLVGGTASELDADIVAALSPARFA